MAPLLLFSERMTQIDLAAINPLTSRIIKCGVEVHRRLGPGLLESVYPRRGSSCGCRVTVVETAGTGLLRRCKVLAVHEAQLLTYLRLTDRPVGLLLNFNVPILKEGICRKLNPGTTTSTKTPTTSVAPCL